MLIDFRLLGPNTAQDLLQLTSNFNSQPSSNTQSRVVFANSDFRILATEDEVFEIQVSYNSICYLKSLVIHLSYSGYQKIRLTGPMGAVANICNQR